MKKDLILEELARMREIMGISNTIKKISSDIKLIKEVQINLNENLITEAKADPIDLLKAIAGQKMVDEVTALSIQSSKYFTEELTKRLANTELKTIDDLSKAMADEYKAKGWDKKLTNEQIAAYVARRPELQAAIDEAIMKMAQDIFDKKMANMGIEEVFKQMDNGETIFNTIKSINDEPITKNTREIARQQLKNGRDLLDSLENIPNLSQKQKQGIGEMRAELDTFESRINQSETMGKTTDSLDEVPITPKTKPNYKDDMSKMFDDEEEVLEDVLNGNEKWDDLLEEKFDELNVNVKDRAKFKENSKKLLLREGRAEDEFFDYFDGMTDDEFIKYCDSLERKINKKVKNNDVPSFYREYMDKLKKAAKAKNQTDMRFIMSQMFGFSKTALTVCIGYQAFKYYVQLGDVEGEEVWDTIQQKGWGKSLGGTIVQDAVGCGLAAFAPGLFIPYEIISQIFGSKVYQNNLDDFEDFVEDQLDDDVYDIENFGKDDKGYFVYKKDNTGNFTIKAYYTYDKKDKIFIERGQSSNKTTTTTKYDNTATGYKKFVEDNGNTYGNAGGYVFEDGEPWYKDGNGNWQLGTYDDENGTFKIN